MSDTPRSDAACALCHGFGVEAVDAASTRFVSLDFARKIERELSAATAELAATKEQLRVAREAMDASLDSILSGSFVRAECLLHEAMTLTQPNLSADSLGGGNPAKGEGGVPLTFPA